jgi:large subunit ribosomal protein L1
MGKVSFGPEKIVENVAAFIEMITKIKPSASKGIYLKSIAISTTMGPGFKVDTAFVKDLIK